MLEKDVNLAIAKKAEKLLEEKGFRVIMTRSRDAAVGEKESVNKKAADLRARCRMINTSAADCAVSIHQNSYSDEAVKGAQVFYFEHSVEGERLAKHLQAALVERLDPDNRRQVKGNTTYYLLKKTEIPLVIVESGFLSNRAEAELLVTEAYQEKIAQAVAEGVQAYLKES